MLRAARANVLVIDDEPGIRDMLTFELQQEGFAVQTAASGYAAVEAIKRHKFELAITDLKMPGMDGVQTLSALRSIDPDIEVIVTTGYATVETALACVKQGAWDFIEKPYDLGSLIRSLELALQSGGAHGLFALCTAARTLLASVDSEQIVPVILDITGRVLRTHALALQLAHPRGGASAFGTLPPDVLQSLIEHAAEDPVRLPNAVVPLPALADRYGMAGALLLPLRYGGHGIGHLVVGRAASSPVLSDTDYRLGSILAALVALRLETDRLQA